MRDHLVFFVNGHEHQIRGTDAFLSLSDFLRHRLGYTGTKIVCSEGDCGSCTVLLGRLHDDRLEYQSVDSCIQFLFQLDGTHVVTIEGIQPSDDLTSVQRQMVDCHGSQCGFCTPGFVMAMTATLEQSPPNDESQWREKLTGNLCRCTGYTPILDAALRAEEDHVRLSKIYPNHQLVPELKEATRQSVSVTANRGTDRLRFESPTNLADALDFLNDNPDAVPVAGATDLGVQINKRAIAPSTFLDLNRIAELKSQHLKDGNIVCGARTTWTELEDLCRDQIPELFEIISIFGSPQIRNVGTIGGNIINASPIADSLPLLFVMEAKLELQSHAGSRTININDFYLGYKKLARQHNELLTNICIPIPGPQEMLQLVKVSRRRDLDISSFTAAIRMRVTDDTVQSASLAYGAVGPTVLRLPKTEQFLQGKPFSEATMAAAGDLVSAEISPISDVRGSSNYRHQLARNVLVRFYHQSRSQPVA